MNMRVQASYAMPHSGLARCRELVRGAGRAARLFLALCVALLAVQAVFAIHQIDGDARLPAVALLAGITALLLISFARQLLRLRRAVALLEDMTEEMASAVTAAEARNRANSEFMATIGHEIRTPLNAILGMAELLSHARLGMQERSHVDVITSSGTTLLEMLNDILDFAKTEHGSMSTETVAFDVRSLAADAMRIVEGRARERFNRTAMHVEGLPEPCWYRGDPTLIKRVLLNLLSNAVKFTEKGDVTVRISEARAGSFLRFDVTDTGIGIPEEARTRLFTAFSQADGSIGRRFGGTGLGLVICKRIVTLMGGSIGYESIPGRGSRFWFEIPAVRTEPADGASVQPAFDLGQSLPALRVLVVEDHPVNRQVAEQFLLMLGQKVAFASDGAEGVAMAADGNFDLILMDMEMPVMDGIAATRAIRGSGNKVKIVAMTANASDEDRARCAEAGMDGFAVKPVSLRRLSALIAGAGAGSGALAAVAGPEQQGQVWNEERLNELLAAVGEDGMRDLLRLFHADVPPALADLSRAVAARDAAAVDRTLHALKGAAANLGLAAVAALAESLRRAEIDRSMPDRLAAEIGRAGIIPDIKKAA